MLFGWVFSPGLGSLCFIALAVFFHGLGYSSYLFGLSAVILALKALGLVRASRGADEARFTSEVVLYTITAGLLVGVAVAFIYALQTAGGLRGPSLVVSCMGVAAIAASVASALLTARHSSMGGGQTVIVFLSVALLLGSLMAAMLLDLTAHSLYCRFYWQFTGVRAGECRVMLEDRNWDQFRLRNPSVDRVAVERALVREVDVQEYVDSLRVRPHVNPAWAPDLVPWEAVWRHVLSWTAPWINNDNWSSGSKGLSIFLAGVVISMIALPLASVGIHVTKLNDSVAPSRETNSDRAFSERQLRSLNRWSEHMASWTRVVINPVGFGCIAVGSLSIIKFAASGDLIDSVLQFIGIVTGCTVSYGLITYRSESTAQNVATRDGRTFEGGPIETNETARIFYVSVLRAIMVVRIVCSFIAQTGGTDVSCSVWTGLQACLLLSEYVGHTIGPGPGYTYHRLLLLLSIGTGSAGTMAVAFGLGLFFSFLKVQHSTMEAKGWLAEPGYRVPVVPATSGAL